MVTVKWLGHAAFQIKGKEKIVYIDLGEGVVPSEKADIVLVTHSHWDHCDSKVIRSIMKGNTVVIAPKECASTLKGGVKLIEAGEKIRIDDTEIMAVHAYNIKRFRSPGVPFHPKGFGVGYVIKIDGKSIYHAGDTDFIPEMKELGAIDVALLPTGDTYTMNSAEAAEAALAINPKMIIAMHYWNTNPEEVKRILEGRSKIVVKILRKGEELLL
ncbi:MAG: MBL fold metallo-hydrolase [Candidatus Methanomethylicaceae archaeon]